MSTTIKLNDRSEIPNLAFGTGMALYNKDCTDSVKLAIDCGFTHLDTAQAYLNEAGLGAAVKQAGKPRSELYIVTKLKSRLGAAQVKASLVESLQKLGLDFVDLFLIHTPRLPEDGSTLQEVWQAMEAVHAEGLAKSIGVSNFRIEDLEAILPGAKIIPSVNQLEIHPSAAHIIPLFLGTEMLHRYVWKVTEPLVKYGLEHGITPAAYTGLAPLVHVPGGPVDEMLPPIAERLGKTFGKPVTLGQVLFKWLLQKGAIVVTTSSKEARIKEYLETPSIPDLTAEEVQAIDDAGAKLHKRIVGRDIFGDA
ncbi:oxidoreductase [Mycena polygramma]|nr:oxidoreductase [Mycena polygramma]